ncbi:MAG: hypothetical protein ACKO2G_06815 [Verrucomicrobiales bacterium]
MRSPAAKDGLAWIAHGAEISKAAAATDFKRGKQEFVMGLMIFCLFVKTGIWHDFGHSGFSMGRLCDEQTADHFLLVTLLSHGNDEQRMSRNRHMIVVAIS